MRDSHLLHYYNRQFGYSLRPARESTPDHDPYAPGLHHFCFRVVDEAAVDRAAQALDPSLTLTRIQYPAIVGKIGNRKPVVYAKFTNPCNSQQYQTAHAQ